jgi:hypothetical protein
MIEMAIGVTIFLTASLGALQLGISALSAEGVQSAALIGARSGSSAPVPGDPVARLAEGQSAAQSSLRDAVLDLARLEDCTAAADAAAGCGLPLTCVEYDGDRPRPKTEQSCPPDTAGTRGMASLGPSPSNLDGSQNPACHGADCFGIARSMVPCARSYPPGQLYVCLAYTSWPATAVDIWIRGTLRTIVPVASADGIDGLPVSVQLRLQVEALSS